VVCVDTTKISPAPTRCSNASIRSEEKKRSEIIPMKNGLTSAAIAVAP
jgi:hypothetical protein